MNAKDFVICFAALLVFAVIVFIGGCSVPVVGGGLVVMVAVFGLGHALIGEGPDVRQRRASNHSIRLRNAQRDEYWAAGGKGEPPNLAPRIEPPAKPNTLAGVGACLLALALVLFLLYAGK